MNRISRAVGRTALVAVPSKDATEKANDAPGADRIEMKVGSCSSQRGPYQLKCVTARPPAPIYASGKLLLAGLLLSIAFG